MKRISSFIFLALVSMSLLVACSSGQSSNTSSPSSDNSENTSKDAKVIKAGIGLNDKHPQYQGLLKFKEIVEEKTEGAIIVETYHSGQLGDDRQMIENLQLGSQEVTIPSTAPLANFVPEFNIFNFPFLLPNSEVADQVLDGEVGSKMLKKLESSNLVGLSYWEEGFYNISNSVRPIKSAEDLKGIKIRTMENQVLLDVFEALGANPTPMAFGEVYTALQQGVVDAQTNPPSQIFEAGFYEVQDYVSQTNDFYGVWVFLMSKDFYDSLSPEQQKIVEQASIEARDYQRQLSRDMEKEYVEKLIAEGVEYNELSPEALDDMKDIIQPVLDKYAQEMDEDFVKEFYAAIEEASK